MPDNKNLFEFGTGSIDKDQWLRDIDNEQEDFITRYGSATNKHRTALLRQAFQDLRTRIANGDMLNRTADGQYQFGSALIRDDKHMQEAYQRALGFMGNLARRQINTPVQEPEKKKITGSTLEDEYKKSLGPDGRFNEKAYWARTPEERSQGLLQFLTSFKNNLNDYQDFSSFTDRTGLESKLDAAIKALNDKKYDDWSLSQLGFTSDWINKPQEEVAEQPKDDLAMQEEQIAQQISDFTRKQNIENQRKQLAYAQDANFSQDFNLPTLPVYSFQEDLNKHTPQWGNQGDARTQYYNNSVSDLSNYFSKLSVDWRNLATQQGITQNDFLYNLARLFSKTETGEYPYQDIINKLFSPTNDGRFLLKNTSEENDRRVFYNPNEGRFEVRGQLQIPSQKQGGTIKFQGGGGFNFSDWDKQNNSQYYVQGKQNNSESHEQYEEPHGSEEITPGDIINIAGPLALDITSMLTANALGVGTLVSAGTGIGSTIWQGINNWDNNNILGSLGSIGTGLAADAVGLIPGLGIAGKVGKIAKGLTKNAKYLGLALNALGATEAAGVLYKGVKNGFNLSLDEWKTLSYGLAGIAQGGAGIKRANRTNLRRSAATKEAHITYDTKGNKHIKTSELGGEKPIGTESTKYVATKESLVDARGKTKGNRITSAPSKRYLQMLYQPKDNIVLYPWETIQRPSIDLFGSKKINRTFEESVEWLKKRKAKRSKSTDSPEEAPKETPKEQYGGILKALRNGGNIQFLLPGGTVTGVGLSSKAGSWYDDVFSKYGDTILNRLGSLKGAELQDAVDWLNGMQSRHAVMHQNAGNNFNAAASGDFAIQKYQEDYDNGNGFTTSPGGFNTLGIGPNFNTRYDFGGKPRNTGDNVNQKWEKDGYYSQITDDRRLLGRNIDGKDDWSPENLKLFNEKLNKLGYNLELDTQDNYYKINPLQKDISTNPNDDVLKELQKNAKPGDMGQNTVVDRATEQSTPFETKFKNPFDPTLLTIAGKTLLGLRGNRDIYGNLLKEMPEAPLRDPINRQLAIVGWQERIKQGQNELADLRRIQQIQQGSDQQTNFATALETERTGRGIMDKAFAEDSGRQFETAQKLWNLKNEDILYNIKVGDDNKKAIADRARMMAQIRAARRSGDNNIKMGAFSDASNWLLKRYQREQDIVNLAREQSLGTKEEFLSNYISQLHPDYEALKTEYEDSKTSVERKKEIAKTVQSYKVEALRKVPSAWSEKIYETFHTPGFGGGYYTTIGKDGMKLEVEKLKARGKDNDRYVSMIKDLRQSSRRRRRR